MVVQGTFVVCLSDRFHISTEIRLAFVRFVSCHLSCRLTTKSISLFRTSLLVVTGGRNPIFTLRAMQARWKRGELDSWNVEAFGVSLVLLCVETHVELSDCFTLVLKLPVRCNFANKMQPSWSIPGGD